MKKKKIYLTRTKGTLFRQLPIKRQIMLTLIATFVIMFSWAIGDSVYKLSKIEAQSTGYASDGGYYIDDHLIPYRYSELFLKAMPRPTKSKCVNDINTFLDTYPNTPWKGMGEKIYSASRNDCQAAKWVVAIGCTESSCGRNAIAYNAWGLKGYDCRKVKCTKAGFEMWSSWDEAFKTYVQRTYKPYLSKKSMLAYRGVYCQSSCINWENHIYFFLTKLNYY